MTYSALADLPFWPYLNDAGDLNPDWQGKTGAYAIYDQRQALQYIGYSRDVRASLLQHLVRQVDSCYWVKLQWAERPSRTLLEDIRQAWIAENGALPPGNGDDQSLWCQPITVKPALTEAERLTFDQSDDLGQAKLLKTVARRLEAERLAQLQARGAKLDIRFNPKLKEQGLLDVK
jgi:hypothetical protein